MYQQVKDEMTTAPERGTDYWRLTPTGGWLYTWLGSQEDYYYLRAGLAFLSRDALIRNLK